MNALLIYPEFPETFWSFKHALKFLGKRAAQPPLGLMTVAALLPRAWKKRLVDTNVERLRDRDLAWADVVLLSGMHIQRESLLAIVERCRARGLRTVVGGPIASSVPAAELKADHVVIGEAESLIADLARDLEEGTARPVYQAAERPEMAASPLPDLSLIKMKRYSTMTVQYSRGCPFNCEFCDIIEIYGRRPRTKAVAQVLAELDQLRAAGWREAVFIVDDNFIGNKARAKELLRALVEWRTQVAAGFDFITEASLNLADDAELMQLMKDAGFKSVFLGIETPDESGLIASNKLQNTRRSLLESVARIQSYGIEVMGGFILGFDTDKEDIFDRMVEFIEKSGIPIAMVGLLQAMPGTQLFRRLRQRGPDCGRGRRQQHLLRPAELFAPHGCGTAGGGLPRGDEEDLQLRGLLRAREALLEPRPPEAGQARGRRAGEEPAAAAIRTMDDAGQPARAGSLDRAPGSFRPAPMELLEVSCGGGDAVSPLLRRGHDPGGHGLSLPGDDAKAVEGDRFSHAARRIWRNPAP